MMSERGVIAVTGAGRGIGAAIALELARRGYLVGCLTRAGASFPAAPGPTAPSDVEARLIPYTCDVTDDEAVAGALGRLAEDHGSLTGLVNNAGLQLHGSSAEFSTADFARILAVNATAAFVVSREAYPHLAAAGGGTIVNIGSFFDKLGVPRNTAYAASKAALAAITRCLAVEWAAEGIRVVNVAPGYIETDLNRDFLARDGVKAFLERRIPTGGAGTPGEVGRLVAAIFDEGLSFLTGETIYMDGGHSIAH